MRPDLAGQPTDQTRSSGRAECRMAESHTPNSPSRQLSSQYASRPSTPKSRTLNENRDTQPTPDGGVRTPGWRRSALPGRPAAMAPAAVRRARHCWPPRVTGWVADQGGLCPTVTDHAGVNRWPDIRTVTNSVCDLTRPRREKTFERGTTDARYPCLRNP